MRTQFIPVVFVTFAGLVSSFSPSQFHVPSSRYQRASMKAKNTRYGGRSSAPTSSEVVDADSVILRDATGYATALALGTVPLVDWAAFPDLSPTIRLVYFLSLAVVTVFVGVQRQDISPAEAAVISRERALAVPFVASASLFGLYCIITYTGIEPGALYRAFACLFGVVSVAELSQPIFGALASKLDPEPESQLESLPNSNAPSLAALCLGLGLVGIYWQGNVAAGGTLPLPTFAAANNLIGWSIATSTLGVIAIDSFAAGALLLSALFCYDAFWVFKSDVMMTVATQIEAPVKLLFTSRSVEAVAATGGYPYSILGLGDIVIPGAFVSLLRQVDLEGLSNASERTSAAIGGFAGRPYFRNGIAAYAAGLAITFLANYYTSAGQPALVYIVPSLLVTSLATATVRGELEPLLGFQSKRAAEAEVERKRREANDVRP